AVPVAELALRPASHQFNDLAKSKRCDLLDQGTAQGAITKQETFEAHALPRKRGACIDEHLDSLDRIKPADEEDQTLIRWKPERRSGILGRARMKDCCVYTGIDRVNPLLLDAQRRDVRCQMLTYSDDSVCGAQGLDRASHLRGVALKAPAT